MTVRPYACIIAGELKFGLELELDRGIIREIRPRRGSPEPFVLAPAFVNAHSHLEYRDMAGQIVGGDFIEFIRQITEMKRQESESEVWESCQRAAAENRAGGVAIVTEHSDRPGAARAMQEQGLEGRILQELITIGEKSQIPERWAGVRIKAQSQQEFGLPVSINPHAIYSVDFDSLREVAGGETQLSIHLAESSYEREFTEQASGPFADLWSKLGWELPAPGRSPIEYARDAGVLRAGDQVVHACDASDSDIEVLLESGVSVAHCPRSNAFLCCPSARIRRMVEAGIPVGIGTDSAATGGVPDMFAEMRAALQASITLGEPLAAEQVFDMATGKGAESVGLTGWSIEPSSSVPLIKINIPGLQSTEELIAKGSSAEVEWLETNA